MRFSVLGRNHETTCATSRKESNAFNLPAVQTYVWNSRTRKHRTINFNGKGPIDFLRSKSYPCCHIPCAFPALSSEQVGTRIQLAWKKPLQPLLQACATNFIPALLLVLMFIPVRLTSAYVAGCLYVKTGVWRRVRGNRKEAKKRHKMRGAPSPHPRARQVRYWSGQMAG